MTASVVGGIGGRLLGLAEVGTAAADWLAETPLMSGRDLDGRLRRLPLETAIEEHADHLHAVCHRPVSRLRVVREIVPVSRARRVVPETISRLAAHSEDWAGLTPGGIRPNRLVSPGRMLDLDFYENRVVAQTVDRVWHHLDRRIAELDGVTRLLDDVDRYLVDASTRPWRTRQYMYLLVAELISGRHWRDEAAAVRAGLVGMRDGLATLRAPGILPGVRRRAEAETGLRPTNLFANDKRYRHVADLWQAWVDAMTETIGGVPGNGDRTARFAAYSGLVLLHAADQAGWSVGTEPLTPGGGDVTLVQRTRTLRLRWETDGTFLLLSKDRPFTRVVPLLLTLSGDDGPDALDGTVTEGDVPTLVVYPGTREEREKLPRAVRLRVFHGFDTAARLAFVPVSPLEIDSMSRVARGLRHALARAAVRRYARPSTAMPTRVAGALAEGVGWLTAGPTGLVASRPPTPAERAAAHAAAPAAASRDAARSGADERLVTTLREEIAQLADEVAEVARCPLCGADPASPYDFQPRDDDTFHARCRACDSSWETRRCACGDRFPVLRVDGGAPRPADGDGLDRLYAGDLLATPCWVRATGYVCSSCGTCAQSRSIGCDRCHTAPMGS